MAGGKWRALQEPMHRIGRECTKGVQVSLPGRSEWARRGCQGRESRVQARRVEYGTRDVWLVDRGQASHPPAGLTLYGGYREQRARKLCPGEPPRVGWDRDPKCEILLKK